VTRGWLLTHNGSKHALWRQEVPFGVPTMADDILGFKHAINRQKWPSIGTFERSRTDSRRMTSWKTYVIGVARRNWSIGVYYL